MAEALGRKIKKLREAMSLTQVEFAALIGKQMSHKRGPHPSTIYRWENGTSTPSGEYLQVLTELARRYELPNLF